MQQWRLHPARRRREPAADPDHIVEFYGLLGGGHRAAGVDGSARPVSRLAIIPGTTHYDVISSPVLPAVVVPFLDAATLP
jgi:hypothetical protein